LIGCGSGLGDGGIGDVGDWFSDAADAVGGAISDVGDFVTSIPVVGDIAKAAYNLSGIGIVVDIAGGGNVGDAIVSGFKDAAAGAVTYAKYGSLVASFVPGVGTGVAAALSAGSALAQGKPITQAVIDGVRAAVPGGVIAQAAFDIGAGLVQGKSITASALAAVRDQIPGGPLAQVGFDIAVSVVTGKKLQESGQAEPSSTWTPQASAPPSPISSIVQAVSGAASAAAPYHMDLRIKPRLATSSQQIAARANIVAAARQAAAEAQKKKTTTVVKTALGVGAAAGLAWWIATL
jgi:hypothetical protein